MNYRLLYLVLTLLLLSPRNAVAKEVSGLQVDPAFSEVTLDSQNTEKKLEIRYTNLTPHAMELKIYPKDFKTDYSGEIGFVGEGETYSYSLSSFLSLESDSLELNPTESKVFKVTIKNREDVSPGAHYAAVVANVSAADGGNSNVIPSVASMILLKKSGGERFSASINDVNWGQNLFNFSYPDKITFALRNDGNIHLVPFGTITIHDAFGRLISKGIVNMESRFVLPETRRFFSVSLAQVNYSWPISVNTIAIEGHDSLYKVNFYARKRVVFINPWIFLALPLLIGFGYVVKKHVWVLRVSRKKN